MHLGTVSIKTINRPRRRLTLAAGAKHTGTLTQGNALRCWIVERDERWYDEVFRPAVFQFQGALEGYEYEHDQMTSAKESDDA